VSVEFWKNNGIPRGPASFTDVGLETFIADCTAELRRRADERGRQRGIVYHSDPGEPGYGTPDIEATAKAVGERVLALHNDDYRFKINGLSHASQAIIRAIVELIAASDR
jgi:hypothetical protein